MTKDFRFHRAITFTQDNEKNPCDRSSPYREEEVILETKPNPSPPPAKKDDGNQQKNPDAIFDILDQQKKIQLAEANVNLIINYCYRLVIRDDNGKALSSEHEWRIRQNHYNKILSMLASLCDQYNAQLNESLTIHEGTPPPDSELTASMTYEHLKESPPEEPLLQTITWLDRLRPWRVKTIKSANLVLSRQCQIRQIDWQNKQDRHNKKQLEHWHNRFSSTDNAEKFVRKALNKHFNYEHVNIRFSVTNGLKTAWINTEFTEIKDFPGLKYNVIEKELRLSTYALSGTQKRKYYMQHVHAVGLRIIGEFFRAVPVDNVIFSGHTPRLNANTRNRQEDYLYSVIIERSQWQLMDYSKQPAESLPDLLKVFDLRRNMSKTGIFKPITPFSEADMSPTMAQSDIFMSHHSPCTVD